MTGPPLRRSQKQSTRRKRATRRRPRRRKGQLLVLDDGGVALAVVRELDRTLLEIHEDFESNPDPDPTLTAVLTDAERQHLIEMLQPEPVPEPHERGTEES